ncbi:MAG: 4Fe-4S binding protein [Lachnospiraceae bacterium]
MKPKPIFDYENCVSCGVCAQSCPLSCIELSLMRKQGKYTNLFPEISDIDKCISCSMCANDCPMGCIEMGELS